MTGFPPAGPGLAPEDPMRRRGGPPPLQQQRGQGSGAPASSPNSAIEPPSNLTPPKISFNGKEYEIIITHHGDKKNPYPGVSQQFTTLFAMTLQYGIAALMYQHNLDEKAIKLKYIKIKKKVNGDLFLTYKDKKNGKKYKIQITNDLEIRANEVKDLIAKESPNKNIDTAYKTHETAMNLLDNTISRGSSRENNSVGFYELQIPKKLSKSAKEFLDKPESKHASNLESKGNSSANNSATEDPIKNSEKKSPENPSTAETPSSPESQAKKASGSEETSAENASNNDNEGSTEASSAASETESGGSPVGESSAPKEKENPLTVSEEEKDISIIPYKAGTVGNSAWQDYLLNGNLLKKDDRTFFGRLFGTQRTQDLITRSVAPEVFTKGRAQQILNKIINAEVLSSSDEKIFLKRFLLQCLAYKKANNDPEIQNAENLIKRLHWIIAEANFFNDEEKIICSTTLSNKDNETKIYNALGATLTGLERQITP